MILLQEVGAALVYFPQSSAQVPWAPNTLALLPTLQAALNMTEYDWSEQAPKARSQQWRGASKQVIWFHEDDSTGLQWFPSEKIEKVEFIAGILVGSWEGAKYLL